MVRHYQVSNLRCSNKKTCGKEACQPKFYDSIKTTKERVDNRYLTLSKYFSDLALNIFLRKFATP